jgi:hypothetical protein
MSTPLRRSRRESLNNLLLHCVVLMIVVLVGAFAWVSPAYCQQIPRRVDMYQNVGPQPPPRQGGPVVVPQPIIVPGAAADTEAIAERAAAREVAKWAPTKVNVDAVANQAAKKVMDKISADAIAERAVQKLQAVRPAVRGLPQEDRAVIGRLETTLLELTKKVDSLNKTVETLQSQVQSLRKRGE